MCLHLEQSKASQGKVAPQEAEILCVFAKEGFVFKSVATRTGHPSITLAVELGRYFLNEETSNCEP